MLFLSISNLAPSPVNSERAKSPTFAFLAAKFPAVHEAAVEAERQAGVSPSAPSQQHAFRGQL